MANQCNNCNIQNSNPSFSNSGNTFNRININPPPKRYNPGLPNPVTTGSETTDVVNKIINVSSQSAYGGDSIKNKSLSKTNLQTADVLSKVLDVASEMVDLDTGKKKVFETANRKKFILDEGKKKETKILLNQGRKRPKIQKIDIIKKDDKNEKTKKRKYRTVGTVLASSPEFVAKFNQLIKEQPKIIMKQTIKDDLPYYFDGVKIWKDFIEPIRSQGLCGSCWAFASTFCLASRLSIYTNGKYNYSFSPAKMVYCNITLPDTGETELNKIKKMLSNGQRYDYNNKNNLNNISYGCSGETLINTWQFLYRIGVPEDSCLLYGDENTSSNVKFNLTLYDEIQYTCSDFISDSFDYCPSSKKYMISHRAGGYYYVPGTINNDDPSKSGTEYNIRKEIYKWGPCTSGMIVYDDFINWNGNGVYEYDKKSEKIGGHAIVIMGWGEENGKKYWIVRNSWGEDWGDKGYCKVLRGVNHCEIEENCFVGFPNLPGIRLHLDYPILYQLEDYVSKYLYNIHDSGYKNSIYEQIALGKIKDIKIKNLYSVDIFQDFSKFFAGKVVNKEMFLYEDKDLNVLNMTSKLHNNNVIHLKYSIIIILFLLFIFL
jgi:cathepsin B